MAAIPPELTALLTAINARLTAIEGALGGAAAAPPSGDDWSRLASDFNLSIVGGSGKAMLEAADKLGDEGKKLVRAGGGSDGGGRAAAPRTATRGTRAATPARRAAAHAPCPPAARHRPRPCRPMPSAHPWRSCWRSSTCPPRARSPGPR